MIDHLHNLASVFALANQIGRVIHHQMQNAYEWFFAVCGKSYLTADTLGGMFLTMGCFWLLGGLYTILDLTQKPACLYQYKTQDKDVSS